MKLKCRYLRLIKEPVTNCSFILENTAGLLQVLYIFLLYPFIHITYILHIHPGNIQAWSFYVWVQ